MRKRLSRYALVLFVIVAVGFLCALATNELIGGFWSESRLYTHALLLGDQSDPNSNAYIFGQVQIVHDVRWRDPIRLVRVTPFGGKQLVIYDRDVDDGWAVEQIHKEMDRVFAELPIGTRERIADSMLQQVLRARDAGAQAALSVASTGPRPYEIWYRSDGTGPEPSTIQNAQPMVFDPGMQMWYPKPLRFLGVWLLLTGFGVWILRHIVRQVRVAAE